MTKSFIGAPVEEQIEALARVFDENPELAELYEGIYRTVENGLDDDDLSLFLKTPKDLNERVAKTKK